MHVLTKNDIQIKKDIFIPQKLNITEYDFDRLIENLFSTILEFVEKCKDKRVEVYVLFSKNVLYVTVKSVYAGLNQHINGMLKTTKEKDYWNKLFNINKIVDKYNGLMTIHYETDMFCVNMLLQN